MAYRSLTVLLAALLLVLAIVVFITAVGDYLFQPMPVYQEANSPWGWRQGAGWFAAIEQKHPVLHEYANVLRQWLADIKKAPTESGLRVSPSRGEHSTRRSGGGPRQVNLHRFAGPVTRSFGRRTNGPGGTLRDNRVKPMQTAVSQAREACTRRHASPMSLVGFALGNGEGFANVVELCNSQPAKRDCSRLQTLAPCGSRPRRSASLTKFFRVASRLLRKRSSMAATSSSSVRVVLMHRDVRLTDALMSISIPFTDGDPTNTTDDAK